MPDPHKLKYSQMAAPEPRKTVLVVEDNPVNMKLASDLLALHGFHVLQAETGEDALRLMRERIPDLVLTDLHLPGMDGVEFFKRIRADASLASLKVVALTASAMREEEAHIRALGFTDYISKPIDTRRFVEKIRALTG